MDRGTWRAAVHVELCVPGFLPDGHVPHTHAGLGTPSEPQRALRALVLTGQAHPGPATQLLPAGNRGPAETHDKAVAEEPFIESHRTTLGLCSQRSPRYGFCPRSVPQGDWQPGPGHALGTQSRGAELESNRGLLHCRQVIHADAAAQPRLEVCDGCCSRLHVLRASADPGANLPCRNRDQVRDGSPLCHHRPSGKLAGCLTAHPHIGCSSISVLQFQFFIPTAAHTLRRRGN